MCVPLQSIDSDGLGARPLLRSTFQPSDDVAYREASFARSQDSITQPVSYSKLAGQSMTGRGPVQKSRLAPESSAGLSSMAISCSNSCLANRKCCLCYPYMLLLHSIPCIVVDQNQWLVETSLPVVPVHQDFAASLLPLACNWL